MTVHAAGGNMYGIGPGDPADNARAWERIRKGPTMTTGANQPLPAMLKFERFGNAYAADFGESFYIVSLYCGAWCGYYSTAGGPKQVGATYGYKSPVDAMHACQNHAVGSVI